MPAKKKTPAAGAPVVRKDPLASLKMAQIMTSKPVLPAEIVAAIVDYLTVADLIRFARVSRRMCEMVYDDSRWIQRLKKMGRWNDDEARQRAENTRRETTATARPGVRRQSTIDRSIVNGKGRPTPVAEVLFNADHNLSPASIGNARRKSTLGTSGKPRKDESDGFDSVNLSNTGPAPNTNEDSLDSVLTVLHRVKSIRGKAREEYGKVYKALGRYYIDAVNAESPMNSLVFTFSTLPEQQAQMLSQVRTFAYSDFSPGEESRERRLSEMVMLFDTAALLEFRKGYEYKDIQGRMRQYAHVMYTLNGGQNSIEMFLHDNQLNVQKAKLGTASDCIDYSLGYGQLSLERIQGWFDRLAVEYAREKAIIDHVFPAADKVSILFLEKVTRDILSPFLASLFVDANTRGNSTYLRIVSGTFIQTRHFIQTSGTVKEGDEEAQLRVTALLTETFEPHLDQYLAQEYISFKQKAAGEVEQWDLTLSEQAASTEIFLMSNINRQADKKDFMSSFKKVVMMPVNILPSFSGPSGNKTAAKAFVNGESEVSSRVPSRSGTPGPGDNPFRASLRALPAEAPTTELAAKAAIMNTKLENIRSLFSIEVALNLVHAAKASLERAAQFVNLGGTAGEAARHQCIAIFVELLHLVGTKHVKGGFDKAINHLSTYNPRDSNPVATGSAGLDTGTRQVAPLATFLELVNVGDLILQMLDVFYESELVHHRISNRDDFLDPAVKEKKRFEAMLDERVAAGLSKGIDVLMDEVEFVCATTQLPTDFNPVSADALDIGPTPTAVSVIELVGRHTSMLVGSTDKTLLDVFNSEIGLRLFGTLTKHLKRQRISTLGALPLLSDLSAYASFVAAFKNHDLNNYFTALREVGQIYLIEGSEAADMATIVADGEKYRGIFTVEEVLEFAERRSDWYVVKGKVEKAMYGQCAVM